MEKLAHMLVDHLEGIPGIRTAVSTAPVLVN
jgi:hypothetical protein